MSKSNAFETNLLKYLLQAVVIPSLGADLYISLHTANPGETGDQTTNEVNYTGYARVAVTRNATNWSVASGQGSNNLTISFPLCTGLPQVVTHVGIGTDASGAGQLLYYGTLNVSLSIANGLIPQISAFTITED